MKTNITPRMLSIRQTATLGILPEHALRQMEREGRLPSMKIGNKVLVNVDRLIEQLNALSGIENSEEAT